MNGAAPQNPPLLVADALLGSVTLPDGTVQISEAEDFLSRIRREAEDRDVVFLASDRYRALRAREIDGVIPVLLASGLRDNVLADAAVATVHDTSKLRAFFESGNAGPILRLARWRPSETRAEISRRVNHLIDLVKNAGGVTIYGAGAIGRQAIHAARLAGLPIKAILDANSSLHGSEVEGIPVRPIASVARGIDVVVPALGRHIPAITNTLRSHGVRDVMSLSELYYVSRRPGEPETDYLDDLFANRIRYASMFLALSDERSREVLSAVVRHRFSLATDPLVDVAERGHPQWFDPAFLPQTSADVFVDGGAFDGDTVLGYAAARGTGYKHIHAFEIDPDVAARASKRTEGLANVTIHHCGLSDRSDVVSYRKTGSTDGAIGQFVEGAQKVQLHSIDEIVSDRVTFLKLDVEGEEAKSLAGAKRHLVEDRPTLAIALYHKARDIWDLPRQILDLVPDYRLYLRHYTDVAYETVLYARAD